MSRQQKLFDKIWELIFVSGNDQEDTKDEECRKIVGRLYHITSQPEPDYDRIWGKIHQRIADKRRKIIFYSCAACTILLVSFSLLTYFIVFHPEKTPSLSYVHEILPESITLTLPDGKVVGLEKQKDGDILHSEDIVRKPEERKADFQLAADEELKYSVINVPVAAEYRLFLPDGTKVYLNSSSRLRYPAKFARNERRVFLEGEAYFEVESDKDRPFRVEVEGTVVEALGTAFNINAYKGHEHIQTTLVHGKVQVGNPHAQVVLEPGQQAICSDNRITVRKVDCRDFIAWKEGLFVFSRMTLADIMVQMERWYGVEVVFLKEQCKHFTFTGMIDKNLPPSETFQIIEKTVDIHFRMQGKTVIIN